MDTLLTLVTAAAVIVALAFAVSLLRKAFITHTVTLSRQTGLDDEQMVMNLNFSAFDTPESMQAKFQNVAKLADDRKAKRHREYEEAIQKAQAEQAEAQKLASVK